jgi:hypothetical protein
LGRVGDFEAEGGRFEHPGLDDCSFEGHVG